MIDMVFTIDGADQLARDFHEAKPRFEERAFRTTKRHALRTVRTIQTRYRGASATSATATRQGTGILRASYTERTRKLPDAIESQIGLYQFGAKGAALIYGPAHEEGATIRPTKGQFLAIPLPTIRTPSGVAPRTSDFPRSETFVLKGKFGGGIICRKLPNGQIQPLFKLVREVRIPARPAGGAINAAARETEPQFYADIEADAVAAFGGGSRA